MQTATETQADVIALAARLRRAMEFSGKRGSAFVTLTYAQSMDGSIAARANTRTALSGRESLLMTHYLRAEHEAILVGVNTVDADDPQLTVRLCAGQNPQPVVLDSNLRISRQCALLTSDKCRRPIIVASEKADPAAEQELEALGARVVRCALDATGRLDIRQVLDKLSGYRSIMVEGGGTVISSFIRAGCVDRLLVTVAPTFMGGIPSFTMDTGTDPNGTTRFRFLHHQMLGDDLIVVGSFEHHT